MFIFLIKSFFPNKVVKTKDCLNASKDFIKFEKQKKKYFYERRN